MATASYKLRTEPPSSLCAQLKLKNVSMKVSAEYEVVKIKRKVVKEKLKVL